MRKQCQFRKKKVCKIKEVYHKLFCAYRYVIAVCLSLRFCLFVFDSDRIVEIVFVKIADLEYLYSDDQVRACRCDCRFSAGVGSAH